MNTYFLNLYVKMQNLLQNEEGQDLAEYALLVALIACVALATVGTLGNTIKSIFTNLSGSLLAA